MFAKDSFKLPFFNHSRNARLTKTASFITEPTVRIWKGCIFNNNGGNPTPKVLVTDTGTEYEVKSLLSYNEEDTENIYKVIDFFVKNYGTSVLPYAKDSGGNYYCVKNGKIVFWTQDMEFYPVCASFSDFIKLLEAGQ